MKIYIASSWKNECLCRDVAKTLREWGHAVDLFCDDSTGRFVFHWSELDNLEQLDAIRMVNSKQGKKAFKEDKKWLDWADSVVLVLPCGRSAHLEAGYAKGRGKKLYILGDFPKGEFDIMYRYLISKNLGHVGSGRLARTLPMKESLLLSVGRRRYPLAFLEATGKVLRGAVVQVRGDLRDR